jgi:hypothetical protein
MEATNHAGEGVVVIADDNELEWPKRVNVQKFSIASGFFVQKMMSQLHQYHLDDAPNLRSCNLILKALSGNVSIGASSAINDSTRLAHFYGRDLISSPTSASAGLIQFEMSSSGLPKR